MGHAGSQVGPESSTIDQVMLLSQIFLNRQVMNDRDGTEWSVLVDQAARLNRDRAARFRIDPLSRRRICPDIESFAQHGCEFPSHRFSRAVERIGSFDAQNRFRWW